MKFEIVTPKTTLKTFTIEVNRELIDGILEDTYTVNTAINVEEVKQPEQQPIKNRLYPAVMNAFDYMADKPTAHRIKQFREYLEKTLIKLSVDLAVWLKDENDKECK